MKSLKNIFIKIFIISGLFLGGVIPATASDFAITKLLAEKGDVGAQYTIGSMYYAGNGVRQDYSKAFDLYQKAANQGFAEAQNNLGLMYAKGNGVPQNYTTAKKLFKKSCDTGSQYGCYNYELFNKR